MLSLTKIRKWTHNGEVCLAPSFISETTEPISIKFSMGQFNFGSIPFNIAPVSLYLFLGLYV
jgi:hypothetical protein